MTALLRADFEKQFPGGPAVRGELELPADARGVTVLFGPSGAGKTTVLRCLAGLDRPERGSIQFGDETWFDTSRGICLPPQRRGVGYFVQEYALFPHLSVAGNVGYGLSELAGPQQRQRVAEMLELVGLNGLDGRYPSQLSGGERQRVALARCLVRRPRLLLLDEPLSALDAPTREQLRRELRRLLTEVGTPTLLVTHDRTEAIALGDEVVVMDAGRVLQSGRVHEVFSRPADKAVARIVGVETVEPGSVVRLEAGLATVAVGAVQLAAVVEGSLNGDVYVCIRAEDVILEKGAVAQSSARNHLAGRVLSVAREGPMTRVNLHCGFRLAALVTSRSCEEMGLQEGVAVTAAIKAPAVHLIPRG